MASLVLALLASLVGAAPRLVAPVVLANGAPTTTFYVGDGTGDAPCDAPAFSTGDYASDDAAIQAALWYAATDGSSHVVIHLCAGTYELSAGISVTTGDPADVDVTIEGDVTGATTVTRSIDAPNPEFSFFTVVGIPTTFRHLTISGAAGGPGIGGAVVSDSDIAVDTAVFEDNTTGGFGGAISTAGSVAITDGTFLRNIAGAGGGAIGLWDDDDLTIDGTSRFEANYADGCGGAIYTYGGGQPTGGFVAIAGGSFVDNSVGSTTFGAFGDSSAECLGGQGGAVWVNGPITLVGTAFTDNAAPSDGGAIWTQSDASATDGQFLGNLAGFGGGILAIGIVTTHGGWFRENTSNTDDGGAVVAFGGVNANATRFEGNFGQAGGGAVSSYGPVDISAATFVGNSAAGDGGAVYVSDTNLADVRESTFSANTSAEEGGAIYLGGLSTGGPISVRGSTFDRNQATSGGAIYGGATAAADILNATFYENTAGSGDGGAIELGDALDVTHVTFVRNSASGDGDHIDVGGDVVAVNSLFADGDCVGSIYTDNDNRATDTTCPDGDVAPTLTVGDLNLGTLGNWGGPTKTVKLRSPSDALDVDTGCTAGVDQRGLARPQGDGCDAGAFELRGTVVTYTGPSLIFIGTATTGRATLTGTTYEATAGCDLEFQVTGDSTTFSGTYVATTGTKGVGTVTTDPLPIGTFTVIVHPFNDCTAIPDASGNFAVVPDNVGKGTAGGGSYKLPNSPNGLNGQVKFSHIVQVKSTTSKVGKSSVTTVTTKGSLLWTYKNNWRLKAKIDYASTDGTTSTWGTFTCPPEATSGSVCGRFSGAGLLQTWDPELEAWVGTDFYAKVTFVVTVYDGGTKSVCAKNKCTTSNGPDFFGMQIYSNGVALTTASGIPVSAPIRLGNTGSLKAY